MVTQDKRLISRIAKLFEHFTDCHQTSAILRIKGKTLDYSDLDEMFDVFNRNIRWSGAKEGYGYYYFLNLRWAIGLSYVCHSFSNRYDDYCLEKIQTFRDFCCSFEGKEFLNLGYSERKCTSLRKYYVKKIRKIEELFGYSKYF